MKRLWFIIPLFSLTSCFEAVEEISMKKDGSGSFSYILNFSQSRAEINAALKMDSFMGTKLPNLSDIRSSIAEAKRRLENSPGISGVTLQEDYVNYILQIKGNFSSIDKMNNAAKNISVQMGADEKVVMGSFNYTSNDSSFRRLVSVALDEKYIRWAEKLLGNMASKATYTMVIKNERTAAKVTNPLAKISPSGKAVMLRTNARDILKDLTLVNMVIWLN
jgi:hypothetical protein